MFASTVKKPFFALVLLVAVSLTYNAEGVVEAVSSLVCSGLTSKTAHLKTFGAPVMISHK